MGESSDDGCGTSGRRSRSGGRPRAGERARRGARKERVLHTRISQQLSEDIRRLAEDLRVPASNLVRNVLEEVFTVVESVSDDVGDLFGEVVEEAQASGDRIRERLARHRGHRRHSPPDDSAREDAASYPDVLAWQKVTLHRPRKCRNCGRQLERGSEARLGIASEGPGGVLICDPCWGAL